MVTFDRKQFHITYISAYIHDSDEIPTAIPMFSGSGNTLKLVGIRSNVWECRKQKMVAINREQIGNNVFLDSKTRQQRIKKFQRLYSCFRGRATRRDQQGYCLLSGHVGNQRWRPLTGSRKDITHISAYIHGSNKLLTAIPMFSGSGYTTRLLRRLSDVWISCELKMASVNRKLMCAIFDSSQIQT